jgi:hypothetical protein
MEVPDVSYARSGDVSIARRQIHHAATVVGALLV